MGINYVTSDRPLDTLLRESRKYDVELRSAGHTQHEWTSCSAEPALFNELEKRLAEYEDMG